MGLIAEARRLTLAPRDVCGLLTLQLVGTVVELLGIFTLLPVFQYIQADGDVAVLIERHDEWQILSDGYAVFGLPVTLATLLSTSFAFLLLRQIVVYVRLVYQAQIREGMVARVRALAFERFLNVSADYQDRNATGSIVNDLTTELGRSGDYIFGRLYFAGLIIVATAYGLSLPFVSLGMTMVAVVLFGAALAILRRQMKRSEVVGQEVTRANQDAGGFLVERLRTARLVRLAGMEAIEAAQMRRLTERQRQGMVQGLRLVAQVAVVLEPVVIGASFVFIYLSVSLFDTSIEQIGLFLVLVIRLLPVVKELASTRQAARSNRFAFDVVERRLEDMAREREPTGGTNEFRGLTRAIRFENVSFAYASKGEIPAVRDFTAEFAAGTLTALVGPSGAGKSTLIDMIPRLRHPDTGRILFDSDAIETFDLASLRAGIAFAPQTPQLFNVSVADHIRYGKSDATDDDIARAAELAGVTEFVAELPNGYDSLIGDSGGGLSGGQRQRLDLARALVQQAPILILDEPTSNLDAESEVRLREAMRRIRAETKTTIIVIAHRLATVAMADQILVLDHGRLLAQGTHAELVRSGGWYADAFSAQQGTAGVAPDQKAAATV